MSRSPAPVLALPLLLLLLGVSATRAANFTADVNCSMQSCAALDITLLREYVSRLNVSELALNATRTNDSAAVETLPFGALESDWTRLLLLQSRQPTDAPMRDNLMRLSRLLLAAYFDGEDPRLWDLQDSPSGDDGASDEGLTAAGPRPVPGAESQDQQASDVTLGSVAQKKSTRVDAASADNASSGSPAGEGASTTAPKLGRTAPANEASGSDSGSAADRTDNVQSDEAVKLAGLPASSEASEANAVLRDRSREDYRASYGRAKGSQAADESSPTSAESAEDHLKSVEDFFAAEEAANGSSLAGGSAEGREPGRASGDGSGSLEFNTTKSIEEFFAAVDESAAPRDSSVERFFASEESGEPEVGTSEAPESGEALQSRSIEALFDELDEANATSGELLTSSVEALFNETEALTDEPSGGPAATDSVPGVRLLSASGAATEVEEDADGDESVASREFAELARGSSETGPSTVAQLILREASTLYADGETAPGSTAAPSEAGEASSAELGTAKYFGTTVTPSPGDAASAVAEDRSNRTTSAPREDGEDGLFRESTSEVDAMTTVASVESASSQEGTTVPAYPLLGQTLVTFRHEPKSNATILASGKLREPDSNALRNPDESGEQGNSSSSSNSEDSLNPPPTASKSKRRRRSVGGIAAERMSRRKSRERVELVERQYRSF